MNKNSRQTKRKKKIKYLGRDLEELVKEEIETNYTKEEEVLQVPIFVVIVINILQTYKIKHECKNKNKTRYLPNRRKFKQV
jgi:hypothetical protein